MAKEIIASHADKEKTQSVLDNNEKLKRLVHEFCSAFNVYIEAVKNHSDGHKVCLSLAEGLPFGYLGVSRHDGKEYFYYTSSFVTKKRGSVRSSRDTRDSDSITGLLKSVRLHRDVPTLAQVVEQYASGVKYAFRSVYYSRSSVSTNIPSKLAKYLVEHYVTNSVDPQLDQEVRDCYHNLQLAADSVKAKVADTIRFTKGCKLVGLRVTRDEKFSGYVLGKATATLKHDSDGDVVLDTVNIEDIKGCLTLDDHPDLAADLTILKAYMQPKHPYADHNPYNIPWSDSYYSDVDVATGYEGRHILWVLIPNEA